MRVRMKTIMAGPEGGASPGQVVDLAEARARDLVASGFAELVDVETATAPAAPEKAAQRAGGRARAMPPSASPVPNDPERPPQEPLKATAGNEAPPRASAPAAAPVVPPSRGRRGK